VLLQQRHKLGRALNKLLSRRNVGLPHHILLRNQLSKCAVMRHRDLLSTIAFGGPLRILWIAYDLTTDQFG
jgi:hypothetical protein